MSGNVPRKDTRPTVFLGVALVALAAAMGPRIIDEYHRQNLIYTVDRDFQSVNDEIDAFWRGAYHDQVSVAPRGYSTPRLRYYKDDLDPEWNVIDNAVALYSGDSETIRINLDALDDISPFVLAHEYGHHIQNRAGLSRSLRRAPLAQRSDIAAWDQASTRTELQAECLGGVWAHFAAQDGGLVTGRDADRYRLTLSHFGMSETHGSGRQRARWFQRGYESGDLAACDTTEPRWEEL